LLRSWFVLIYTGLPVIVHCQPVLKNTVGIFLFIFTFRLVVSRRIIFGVQYHDVFFFVAYPG
jgi:hypothetical protein